MKNKFLTAIFLVFCISWVKAQEYQDDAVFWGNIYLEKKLNKNLDLHLNHQSRFHDNMTMYKRASFDLGVTYHINKNIRVLFDYVYMLRRNNELLFGNRHRLYAAVILRKKFGKWTVAYRNRVQGQVNDFYSSADGQVPVFYERNKLTVKYDLNKRIGFYVSEELYLPFYQAQNKGFDRSRSFIGTSYSLTKHNEIEVYFGYQHELNAFKVTRRLFIYGVGYAYEF
jgi:predicted porin